MFFIKKTVYMFFIKKTETLIVRNNIYKTNNDL
jgi:hypothetical protein